MVLPHRVHARQERTGSRLSKLFKVYTAGGIMNHERGKTDTKAAWVYDHEFSHSHKTHPECDLIRTGDTPPCSQARPEDIGYFHYDGMWTPLVLLNWGLAANRKETYMTFKEQLVGWIILHWFKSWVTGFFQLMFSWWKSNADFFSFFLNRKEEDTQSTPFLFCLCPCSSYMNALRTSVGFSWAWCCFSI